jgi:hypothetical protein
VNNCPRQGRRHGLANPRTHAALPRADPVPLPGPRAARIDGIGWRRRTEHSRDGEQLIDSERSPKLPRYPHARGEVLPYSTQDSAMHELYGSKEARSVRWIAEQRTGEAARWKIKGRATPTLVFIPPPRSVTTSSAICPPISRAEVRPGG